MERHCVTFRFEGALYIGGGKVFTYGVVGKVEGGGAVGGEVHEDAHHARTELGNVSTVCGGGLPGLSGWWMCKRS